MVVMTGQPAVARYRLLDVAVDHVTRADVKVTLDGFVRAGTPHQVVTVNTDFVRLARGDAAFRQAINHSDLSVADGMPVVWTSRLLGHKLPERVTGVDVVEDGASLAAERGYRIFLLGAGPGVADKAAAELVLRYPGLHIAGTYAPPMGPFAHDEDARMIGLVRAARPDMLFVAFGAPRQDVWIAQHLHRLGVPVCVGVGGTFDFLAGRVPRAPLALQRAGLEWAYRLVREPRRLWRRYLLHDLPVLCSILVLWSLPLPSARRRLRGLNQPELDHAAGAASD